MNILLNSFIVLLTFCGMEFMAWFAHKYIMHGFLWSLHKDHHQKEPGFFEKNDMFFLIFAVPSALCFIFGSLNGIDFRFWIGTGIAVYGMTYFLVHEIFIHQRFSLFKKTDNRYFKGIRKAHQVHHKHLGKKEGECFGLLVIPFKFLKKDL
jgi:beta-carotene 3-hydroxylase